VNSINGMPNILGDAVPFYILPNILGDAVPFYILEQTSLLFDVLERTNLIDDFYSYGLC
jgi:hypothetical protein